MLSTAVSHQLVTDLRPQTVEPSEVHLPVVPRVVGGRVVCHPALWARTIHHADRIVFLAAGRAGPSLVQGCAVFGLRPEASAALPSVAWVEVVHTTNFNALAELVVSDPIVAVAVRAGPLVRVHPRL